MTKTEENLSNALSGESQASRKYIAFAEKAERDGYRQIAKLFRAASESENVHAQNDLLIMKEIGSTEENLKKAIKGETYEYTEMYVDFIDQAEKDGRIDALKVFQDSKETEEYHASYYKEALEKIIQKEDLSPREYYICKTCGYTAEYEAPDECPICGTKKKGFKKVD
jgi:rubrerythrin